MGETDDEISQMLAKFVLYWKFDIFRHNLFHPGTDPQCYRGQKNRDSPSDDLVGCCRLPPL